MPDPNELAAARIERIVRSADALDESAVASALRLVDQLRRELIAELAGQMSEYERGVTSAIVASMDRLVVEFRDRYAREIAVAQARAFDLGTLLVDAPLGTVSAQYFAPYVGRDLLEVAHAYSTDLITGLSADVRERVAGEIRRGVLAGRAPAEVITRIGAKIDKGVFASVAQRAEVITRTEINRVLAMATQARMDQAVKLVPKLRRQWLATLDGRTRQAHRDAHEQIRDVGEPFKVGDEELKFPGDPAGSPENTINCRCKAVPYAASWTDVVEQHVGSRIVQPDWVRERMTAAEVTEEGDLVAS